MLNYKQKFTLLTSHTVSDLWRCEQSLKPDLHVTFLHRFSHHFKMGAVNSFGAVDTLQNAEKVKGAADKNGEKQYQ